MQGFWRLHAWLISLHRAACDRISAQRKITGTSASPTLIFTATALFLVLAILEIDEHRDELRALGLIGGDEGIMSSFVGP